MDETKKQEYVEHTWNEIIMPGKSTCGNCKGQLRSNNKFCNDWCYRASFKHIKVSRIISCIQCNASRTAELYPSDIVSQFCSAKCERNNVGNDNYKSDIRINCQNCHKSKTYKKYFQVYPQGRMPRFCSQKCSITYRFKLWRYARNETNVTPHIVPKEQKVSLEESLAKNVALNQENESLRKSLRQTNDTLRGTIIKLEKVQREHEVTKTIIRHTILSLLLTLIILYWSLTHPI